MKPARWLRFTSTAYENTVQAWAWTAAMQTPAPMPALERKGKLLQLGVDGHVWMLE